jgi:hypothetical protein
VEYDIDMSWAVVATVPEDGGCGTGWVQVTVEPYTLVATYGAPTQTYAWTFSQGDNVIANGTGTAPCSNAVRQPDFFQILGINP